MTEGQVQCLHYMFVSKIGLIWAGIIIMDEVESLLDI